MEYTIENFKDNKFVINCKTRPEADSLMEIFDNNGIRWFPDVRATFKSYWDAYKGSTCYQYTSRLYYGNRETFEILNKEIISFQDFVDKPKSNKEKMIEMIGVEIGEEFEMLRGRYNPYHFNEEFDLIDEDGDKSNGWIISLLWEENQIKKIPKDPNADIKKYIEMLSKENVITKDVREGVILSLKEILKLNETKSV